MKNKPVAMTHTFHFLCGSSRYNKPKIALEWASDYHETKWLKLKWYFACFDIWLVLIFLSSFSCFVSNDQII